MSAIPNPPKGAEPIMLSQEERVNILRNAPPRTWIAFSQDESELVAQAASYEEAVEISESKGVQDPVLLMTPDSWIPLVL